MFDIGNLMYYLCSAKEKRSKSIISFLPKMTNLKMNFKHIIAAAFVASLSLTAAAQTAPSHSKNAHRRAHQEQLANVKSSKMDRIVVSDMMKNDVVKRDAEVIAGLSPENSKLINDMLAEANKHIGKPYRHGMKGPNAFDCSGFTSYVYKQFGFSISPGSRTQYTEGTAVDRKHLRKGDLVFFTSRSSGSNVGHVGMVIEANNETGEFKFIHASVKGVRINSCEGYYQQRYVGARRIIH